MDSKFRLEPGKAMKIGPLHVHRNCNNSRLVVIVLPGKAEIGWLQTIALFFIPIPQTNYWLYYADTAGKAAEELDVMVEILWRKAVL